MQRRNHIKIQKLEFFNRFISGKLASINRNTEEKVTSIKALDPFQVSVIFTWHN